MPEVIEMKDVISHFSLTYYCLVIGLTEFLRIKIPKAEQNSTDLTI